MGAFTALTVKESCPVGNMKIIVLTAVGPASYDSGGSTLDLSSVGLSDHWNGMSEVFAVSRGAADATANSKYSPVYIAAAAGAAATGKLKIHDASQAADAEASGDLSAVTFTLVAFGR